MGILKNFEGEGLDADHINAVPQLNALIHDSDISDSSSSSEDDDVPETTGTVQPANASIPIATKRTVKVKKSVSKIAKPILHVKNVGGKQSQGNRQTRRHENMVFLLNLATDLDEDFAEVNINDLVDTTISAFAQLLLSKNKMKIWNEFIDLPEQQQERIVKLATDKKAKKKKRSNSIKNNSNSDESFETFVMIENRATTSDTPIADPLRLQDEAATCFQRIDSNIRYSLRSMAKRHHLPVDRIHWFEEDIIPFFTEHADSIYLRDLNNGFDRMLLHSVCQYLNLISKSFTRDGERYTQVENHQVQFIPPTILLSEYIQHLNNTNKTHL